MYRVQTARSRVKKQLKRIPDVELTRIAATIQTLSADPRPPGAVQLHKDIYRIRVGNYRIIYKVFEEQRVVLIGRVARRNEDTYRGIGNLFE
jgi:mRNA interferase RelE/StbE